MKPTQEDTRHSMSLLFAVDTPFWGYLHCTKKYFSFLLLFDLRLYTSKPVEQAKFLNDKTRPGSDSEEEWTKGQKVNGCLQEVSTANTGTEEQRLWSHVSNCKSLLCPLPTARWLSVSAQPKYQCLCLRKEKSVYCQSGETIGVKSWLSRLPPRLGVTTDATSYISRQGNPEPKPGQLLTVAYLSQCAERSHVTLTDILFSHVTIFWLRSLFTRRSGGDRMKHLAFALCLDVHCKGWVLSVEIILLFNLQG